VGVIGIDATTECAALLVDVTVVDNVLDLVLAERPICLLVIVVEIVVVVSKLLWGPSR
jgi:hypothetical protein